MSPVELRRIIAEWRLRVSRVKNILQPPTWSEKEWRQFAQALALLVRDHGRSWIIDPNVYWDLRWKLQDGGELVCQVEHIPSEKTSLVVAQTGGFAVEVGSYTWLWAEFNMAGDFARDPYWVEGTWKEALTTLLLPLDRQSSYLLAGRTETPTALLTQEGARPNESYFNLSLMEGDRGARVYPPQNGWENDIHHEPPLQSQPPQGEPPHHEENNGEPAAWDGGAVHDEPAPETQENSALADNFEATEAAAPSEQSEPAGSAAPNEAAPAHPEHPDTRPDGSEARRRRQLAQLARMRSARSGTVRSHRRELSKLSS